MKKVFLISFLILLFISVIGCENQAYNSQQNNDNTYSIPSENYVNEQKQEQHIHSYSNATCTKAATCSCGAVNGTSLGHNWKNASCISPKTCTVCGKTEGNKSEHHMNGQGVCDVCGKDIFLQFVKENVSLKLIVPSVGASNNYYCEVKFVNHTGYNITLSRFVTANGKVCDNASVQDLVLETDYSIKLSFYRATVPEDRWEDRWKDMYLDNNSTGTAAIKVNGRQAVIKFGTNGTIDVGNTVYELD